MWRDGKKAREIADALNCTQGQVEGRIKRLRFAGEDLRKKRILSDNPRNTERRAPYHTTSEEPTETRACNICKTVVPMTVFQRFCDGCRGERVRHRELGFNA